ncbi:Helix-turn-helix of DDE superfamily endonuclease [Actinomadura meyerae]|uniref:Helix-turn-helix of DDE superfamily endonuclease n=1 Tax=Actinomadura meyerae TaxID=240840 RepID=A0A239P4U8_9ACTN|nr:Helix-turn-helix of DDE superfamily endonuclease [Actinomadura meyerae]
MLVHLRKGETFTVLGARFEISTRTAWRYVQEAVGPLSARSPKPAAALHKATKDPSRLNTIAQAQLDGCADIAATSLSRIRIVSDSVSHSSQRP